MLQLQPFDLKTLSRKFPMRIQRPFKSLMTREGFPFTLPSPEACPPWGSFGPLSRRGPIRSKSQTIAVCIRCRFSLTPELNERRMGFCRCFARGLLDLVQYLLHRFEEAIGFSDRSGHHPLHVAAAHIQLRVMWRGLLQCFVTASPDALDSCMYRDNDGLLPLHLALLAPQVSWAADEVLTQACSASLRERGQGGWYSVHLAALCHAPLDVLFQRARSCPLPLVARA
jgi:hypothetical protein